LKQLSRQYAVVFFVGFLALIFALAFGSLAGEIFSSNPTLVSVRFLSAGLMFSGLTLWICHLRDEAGKPGLNMFLTLIVATGVLLSAVRLGFQDNLSLEFLNWGGLALAGTALIIGFLSMVVSPAMPKPLTTHWPEGGEPTESESKPASH
jgi:hypothetical protein